MQVELHTTSFNNKYLTKAVVIIRALVRSSTAQSPRTRDFQHIKTRGFIENMKLGMIKKIAARYHSEVARDAAKDIKEMKKVERASFNDLSADVK